MTRKELAQLAGVSERTLRRWLHANHNQLIAAGYQASQRKLPPRVVKYLMEFYGIERWTMSTRNCNYLDFHVDAQTQKLKT